MLPLQLLTVDPLARHRRHRQMASVLRHWEALLLAQVLAQAAEVVALPVAAEARPAEAEALPQVVRALPVAAQPGPGPELGPAPEPESVQPAPAPGWPQPQILEPRMVSVGVPFLKPHLCCLDALVVPVGGEDLEWDPESGGLQQELCLLLDGQLAEELGNNMAEQGRWSDLRRLMELSDETVSHDWP